MTPADFRRIALTLDGVEEYSHAGLPAFRVGGRKFASLASQAEGFGNLMLTPEQQAAFVEEAPEIFLPIPGGFGKMGHTHIRLAEASEDVVTGALRTAWKLRTDKNERNKTTRNKPHTAERRGLTGQKREAMTATRARNISASQKNLSSEERKGLLRALQSRFEKNISRHKGFGWAEVQARLEAKPEKLWSLA